MMNMAHHFEKRLGAFHKAPSKQLDYAYKLLFSRSPKTEERKKLLPLLKGDAKTRQLLVQALLISNEFTYID